MFHRKYRIITGKYYGYILQRKDPWWPFWYGVGLNNYTHIEDAESDIAIFVKVSKRTARPRRIIKVYKY
jgi:hypothetical protein